MPGDHRNGLEVERLQSLTSLRGIAALAVLAFHCCSAAFGPASGSGLALIPHRGYLAVDFFFILSGFVLAHVYAAEFGERVGVSRMARFLWARIARIYPVHLLATCLFLIFYGSGPAYSGATLLANLFLLQGPWIGFESWNNVSWSISAEWHAYLAFPFFCLVLPRVRPGIAASLALCCFGIVALAAASRLNSVSAIEHGPIALARCIPEFVIGMLTFRFYRSGQAGAWWQTDRAIALVTVAILGLAMAESTDAMIIALLPALLLAGVSNNGAARRLLARRPFVFFGDISYSLYMMHIICLIAVFVIATGGLDLLKLPLAERLAVLGAGLLVTLVVSTLVSRCIEYPVRAALRRVFDRRQPALRPA